MNRVEFTIEARAEYEALPERERFAINSAIEKLREYGNDLGYPHCSAVKNAPGLRELRPRQGRSAWRAFYGRVGERWYIVAAIGAEAQHDPRAFRRAVVNAQKRLAELEPWS